MLKTYINPFLANFTFGFLVFSGGYKMAPMAGNGLKMRSD